MALAIKFVDGSRDRIRILNAPFDGPFAGKDLDGEKFTKDTNFCIDWLPERPLLYGHGMDEGAGLSVIGRIDSKTAAVDDAGLWSEAQLDASHKYFDAICSLIDQGKLYASSGTIAHLARRTKGGEITVWPWVETSLTPSPSNLLAEITWADAEKHFKAASILVPSPCAKALSEGVDTAGGYLTSEEQAGAASRRKKKPVEKKPADKAATKKVECPECGEMVVPDADGDCPECGADMDDMKAKLGADALNALPESDFAYIDSDGDRHLPIPDAEHVRAALARFDQTQFDSAAAKEKARKRILARAKKLGVEVSDEGAGKSGRKGYYPEGSYEDLIEDLNRLVSPPRPFGYSDGYAYVAATFPDYCIVCRCDYDADPDEEQQTYWRVGYTVGADQEPVLTGDDEPVVPAYVPQPTKAGRKHADLLAAAPLSLHGRHIKRSNDAFLQRTEGLRERREQEGRELSPANKAVVAELATGHEQAAAALRALLEPSAAAKAKAAHDQTRRKAEALLQWGRFELEAETA